jgi:FkbM family methyltransferase
MNKITDSMLLSRLRKLSQIIADPFLFSALLKGTVAGVEHRSLLQNLQLDYIVDVGANRGQFALVARKQFPQARIISFEPLAEPAAVFRRVFKSDTLTSLHQIAIGPEEKFLPMHVSRADDSSSLLPISAFQSSLFPGTEEKEIRNIGVKPLNVILSTKGIKSPALLKIDVQGYELEVLKGCLSLLSSFEYIYLECSFMELYSGQALAHEIIAFLEKEGFYLSGVYRLSYDRQGASVQGDFLFKRTET